MEKFRELSFNNLLVLKINALSEGDTKEVMDIEGYIAQLFTKNRRVTGTYGTNDRRQIGRTSLSHLPPSRKKTNFPYF